MPLPMTHNGRLMVSLGLSVFFIPGHKNLQITFIFNSLLPVVRSRLVKRIGYHQTNHICSGSNLCRKSFRKGILGCLREIISTMSCLCQVRWQNTSTQRSLTSLFDLFFMVKWLTYAKRPFAGLEQALE